MLGAAVLAANLVLRDITVVNRTDQAIFTLRIGNSADGAWGDDLLGFAKVIDLGRGITVHVPTDPGNCVNDVQATLRDGRVVVVPQVNLCTVETIDIQSAAQ